MAGNAGRVSLPPGCTLLFGLTGPSPRPSCLLKGVAKTHSPFKRRKFKSVSILMLEFLKSLVVRFPDSPGGSDSLGMAGTFGSGLLATGIFVTGLGPVSQPAVITANKTIEKNFLCTVFIRLPHLSLVNKLFLHQ